MRNVLRSFALLLFAVLIVSSAYFINFALETEDYWLKTYTDDDYPMFYREFFRDRYVEKNAVEGNKYAYFTPSNYETFKKILPIEDKNIKVLEHNNQIQVFIKQYLGDEFRIFLIITPERFTMVETTLYETYPTVHIESVGYLMDKIDEMEGTLPKEEYRTLRNMVINHINYLFKEYGLYR